MEGQQNFLNAGLLDALSEHIESFLPSCKSRTDAEAVKALDRFAAHIRAALTASALGCKTFR